MKTTKAQIKDLKHLLKDDSHSQHHLRIEITKNILPHIFEGEKKFDITKEQIEKAHSLLSLGNRDSVIGYLELWFPEAFKKELEVGKWYKDKDKKYKGLICIEKYNGENNGITAYGFSWVTGTFDSHSNWCPSKENQEDLTEATTQEVETALINEAKKRGLIAEATIDQVKYKGIKTLTKFGCDYVYFKFEDYMTYDGWTIYSRGKWATIIETITIQEAEKLLNKKIV